MIVKTVQPYVNPAAQKAAFVARAIVEINRAHTDQGSKNGQKKTGMGKALRIILNGGEEKDDRDVCPGNIF